jgi:aldehyde dehydrogenase
VTIALSEPLGVIAQIIPELPNINGDLETGSGISCGNTVVLKPAESTPISILVLMELIGISFLRSCEYC